MALKWYVSEDDSAAARAVFATGQPVIAPELIVAEVSNASWKLLRKGELSPVQHARIAAEILETPTQVVPLRQLALRAATLASELDHPVYVCYYLALSEAEDAPLVTADRRLIAKVAGTPFATRTVHLSEAAARG